ncbi:DUF3114 domain-containing protein [Vagococcus zengguangii]|uniref:DUF3114 domain-containing protein n=1 Tax=Vagococcus zengguangii TaxID=2571750 RepID=A0A4D7CNW0_9ENTE|nr:DUF3114 domain-containing protein [Vagococcus zengguangii]QCI85758.1 DUF3114 domain-containing protein [Vagococcus zengguangii]TLG81699.1 DUF3114 domain-containing protein [Vagococcus zengguangii]
MMGRWIRQYLLGTFWYRYRLSEDDEASLAQQLPTIEQVLKQRDGWDQKATSRFINEMAKRYLKQSPEIKFDHVILTGLKETELVGGELYEKMFRAVKRPPAKKIALLLDQMGAQFDENGMLQLVGPHTFDVKMAPHGKFLHYFAKLVQRAYGSELLQDKRLHQFRMYLDEHNIRYIRVYFKLPRMTDEQALQLYVKTARKNGGLGGRRLIAERGRFHNKSKPNVPRTSENRKRLCPNFHGEFIIDDEGEFVSQWNVLHRDNEHRVISDWSYYQRIYRDKIDYFEEQIINGESFNYASWNGKIHRHLDVYPTRRLDYPIRRKIAKKWRSPGLKEYKWRQKDRQRTKYYRRGL